MKSYLTIIILFLLPITFVVGQGLELEIGFFENNAGWDNENNTRIEKAGGFAGLYYTNGFECFSGVLNARYRTNNTWEVKTMGYFDMFWFLEPVGDIFSNPESKVSLLVGSGLLFSNTYFNYLEIPVELRLEAKFHKTRMAVTYIIPAFEYVYFQPNSELTISFYYSFWD